jgi:pSer/pThr/pTyr-binding forkhead associated (FHA) protein
MANAKFCKKCGKELNPVFKTCVNGHNYDAKYEACPYCPSNSSGGDIKPLFVENTKRDNDNTVIDGSTPQSENFVRTQEAGAQFSVQSDKTMLISPDGSSSDASSQKATLRKLVGWLVTYDIQPTGMDFRLFVGRTIIGRGSDCDIVIQKDGVSKEHAVILYRDGKFILQDQLSVNGTFVNEILIEDKVYLNDNDRIRIGNITFILKII